MSDAPSTCGFCEFAHKRPRTDIIECRARVEAALRAPGIPGLLHEPVRVRHVADSGMGTMSTVVRSDIDHGVKRLRTVVTPEVAGRLADAVAAAVAAKTGEPVAEVRADIERRAAEDQRHGVRPDVKLADFALVEASATFGPEMHDERPGALAAEAFLQHAVCRL